MSSCVRESSSEVQWVPKVCILRLTAIFERARDLFECYVFRACSAQHYWL